MVLTKRCVFSAGLIAVGAWACVSEAFTGKKYATVGLILYTFSGATSLMAELTGSMRAMQIDTYAFETSYIIGLDLLTVDVIGAAGYNVSKGRYILVFPLIDLVARALLDETWEPITTITHLLPVSLYLVFAYQKNNLMLFLAGVSFLAFFLTNDFDDVLGYNMAGELFTGMFFLGKDIDNVLK